MTEQRVFASKPKIGARTGAATAPAEPSSADGAPARRSRKLVVLLVIVALLGSGAGYWFLIGPGASAEQGAAQEPPAPEPGVVQELEPISLNLAGGRYLMISLGLQLTAEVEDEIDPSIALDRTITLFSGRTIEDVSSAEGRTALKAELAAALKEGYDGEVIDVFFTTFVTQ
ncbi:flagellar basal body-associated FliL family protein [Actinotalea ferrariae]|uniref:flagellar basal body-associated FliL family protein n=1 Tax=Actinotalea ferrariae TaxID=1386098 RepID=UPI001C8C8F37|nr:flagellar basal body-associated FliL family protein [Actinotalea ferrariae]MBX9243611.1 flagellar basal body-associated FliL family protein [Actinotalea ferrariae]